MVCGFEQQTQNYKHKTYSSVHLRVFVAPWFKFQISNLQDTYLVLPALSCIVTVQFLFANDTLHFLNKSAYALIFI